MKKELEEEESCGKKTRLEKTRYRMRGNNTERNAGRKSGGRKVRRKQMKIGERIEERKKVRKRIGKGGKLW